MNAIARFALLSLVAPVLPLTAGSPAVDYRVTIENTMPHAMDSYYSVVDSTEHLLGTVPGYVTVEYTIKSPPSTTIVITERGSEMPGHVARQTIALRADSVVAVSF